MEASALHAPAGLSRLPLATPLLRLRSDEQLVALFRAGSDDAFGVLHDRYRQRLFAYVRQMLSSHSRQDAEDVLQDVFVRAFGALRGDSRAVNVRAWLYRVAHNRCIDHLRRPHPPAAEIFEMSRKPLLDPVDEAQRRDDLTRLVADVGRLPEQQRSALLMREIDGLSYAELAGALDVTVPAVKSLLVRARVGLVEAQESRDADCGEIRRDLMASYDRGVKASGRARRHMRECDGCREYRHALRGVRRSFAALAPAGAGPAALLAKLIGVGGGAAGGRGRRRRRRACWPAAPRRPRPARSRPSSARPRSPRAAPSRSASSRDTPGAQARARAPSAAAPSARRAAASRRPPIVRRRAGPLARRPTRRAGRRRAAARAHRARPAPAAQTTDHRAAARRRPAPADDGRRAGRRRAAGVLRRHGRARREPPRRPRARRGAAAAGQRRADDPRAPAHRAPTTLARAPSPAPADTARPSRPSPPPADA